MARKARAEVAGGLYHVITRGNNRRQIFTSPADYQKFLYLLAVQKVRLPFFLYAYCLMTKELSEIAGMSSTAMSRRKDAGRARLREDKEVASLIARIAQECRHG